MATTYNHTRMMSFRSLVLVVTILLSVFIARYYIPVRSPGPMGHPWKYRIISGTFAFILEFVCLV